MRRIRAFQAQLLAQAIERFKHCLGLLGVHILFQALDTLGESLDRPIVVVRGWSRLRTHDRHKNCQHGESQGRQHHFG
ncbi:MAG: hypothetical protein ACI8X5_003309 [Planctomycetota bacterium]